MIDVSPTQIMTLWEQLMACVYGDNRYGGTTVEIYIYTLMPYSPMATDSPLSEHGREAYALANRTLYDLVRIFEARNAVGFQLSGGHPLETLIANPDDPFTHRVHLKLCRGGRA